MKYLEDQSNKLNSSIDELKSLFDNMEEKKRRTEIEYSKYFQPNKNSLK